MNFDWYFKVFFPCVCGVMALFFFTVGLRGIVTRKPFLFSARWFFAMFLLILVPNLLLPFLFPMPRVGDVPSTLALDWLNPIMVTVLTVFMGFTMRGYMAFAVTDSSFREGLLASLEKLGLRHEEKVAAMHLPSVGADLQVAIQSWVGMGQIKMKQWQFSGLLRDIVKGMNEYYQNSTTQVNLISCVFYVIMGVFMVVFAVLTRFQKFV